MKTVRAGFARQPWAVAPAIAVPLAGGYLLLRPPSGDLAAATYRSELLARVGLGVWDAGWYGGHYLPGYSLLSPALGALIGNRLQLALCAVLAAVLFGLICERLFAPAGARVAAGAFALGVGVGLLSGRVAYGLGVVLALLALLTLLRGRTAVALALAVLCSLASPVAGAFLALVALADALAARSLPLRRRSAETALAATPEQDAGRARAPGLALAAAALAPILALALVFPEGGWEPFAPSLFWPALAGVVAIALGLGRAGLGLPPRALRALTWGAWLYALALAGSFALHTPVGGNAARLGALLAAPLLGGLLWERRRFALLALAPALLYWQLETPLNDFAELAGDPSVNASYYAPLRAELLRRAAGSPLRVEIPMTGAHWESVYVPQGGSLLLARGWERQLDTRYGSLFYEPTLTAGAYRRWLASNAVAYVALPSVRLDFAGQQEGRLIAGGLPYLHQVWRSAHWRLFAVSDPQPLVQAPARLLGLDAQSFTLAAPRPGRFEVRVRFTPYWAVAQGSACVLAAGEGWSELEVRRAGVVRVGIDFALGRLLDHGPRCHG